MATRKLTTKLPKPTREQVKQSLGPFATSAQVDAHFRKYGRKAKGLGETASGLPRDTMPSQPGRGTVYPPQQAYKTPKHCVVRRAVIRPEGIEIGYSCGNPSISAHPLDERGREGMFPTPSGGWGTYPSLLLKGIHSIGFRGMSVSGNASTVGFVLSPASATCKKSKGDRELRCALIGDTSTPNLAGTQPRRKRR